MHNKVVFHAMKALHGFGFPVLRFNFRGTGLSLGEHDQGRGEVEDVRTALAWLKGEFDRPLIFAGFSFGAAIGVRAAAPDDRVIALIALGLPLQPLAEPSYDLDVLRTSDKPKLFLSGSRDPFASRAQLEAFVETLPAPKELVLIDSADHFFAGRLREMRQAIELWTQVSILG